MIDNKLIVVPWDFTEVAHYALQHAIRIAKIVDDEIVLLHILDKGITGGEESATKEKLKMLADKTAAETGLTVKYHAPRGSIFTEIADYANDYDASLVVMGTHGIKGMQKLTGSWALKVILKSKAPFIVVQDKPNYEDKISNIVFSIDFRSETKEKMAMAIYMGKYFDSKIHIIKHTTTDKSLSRKINVNLGFAVKYFAQNNIAYEVHDLPKGNLGKQTIEFAQEIKAEMILIVTSKHLSVAALGATEQYIIANSSKIPVCCVNPRASSTKGVGQFMYGS